MDISELTIRLIILLLPGILAALIVDKLTIQHKWSYFRFTVYSILLGAASYLAYQMSLYLIAIFRFLFVKPFQPSKVAFWESLFNPNIPISPKEVIIACCFSILLGLLVSAFVHHRWLNKIAYKIKVSDKYGDENLFTHFLNDKETNWIWIRDIKNNLTYEGLRVSFSESENIREIVLRDVKVYKYENSAFLYEIPELYLSFPIGELLIEKPPPKQLEMKNG
jgi:hypothetical protein